MSAAQHRLQPRRGRERGDGLLYATQEGARAGRGRDGGWDSTGTAPSPHELAAPSSSAGSTAAPGAIGEACARLGRSVSLTRVSGSASSSSMRLLHADAVAVAAST